MHAIAIVAVRTRTRVVRPRTRGGANPGDRAGNRDAIVPGPHRPMRVLDSPSSPSSAIPRVAATFERAAWALAACVVAIHIALLWRFAVDWPLHDDFTQIVAMPGYLVQLPTLREKLALLTELALEHRAATIRLAGWIAAAAPGGMNFLALIALGNALALGAGIVAIFAFPRAYRGAAALLAALLLTSLTHYAAQYHATGALQHFGVAFYALASLFALSKRYRVVATAFALAAVFTSGSGLLVLPCAAALTWLSGRRKEAAAWAFAGVAVMALYFIGYEGPATRSNLASLVGDPLRASALALAAFGCIGGELFASLAIGAVAVLVWLGLLGTGAWRRVPPFVIAASLFFALALGVIAAGRASFGIEAVLLSRYRIGSGLLALMTVAALSHVLDDGTFKRVQRSAIACAAALYAIAFSVVMTSLVDLHVMQLALRDHFAADNSGHYDGYRQEWGDFTLRRAREIGVYVGERHARPPASVQAALAVEGPGPRVLHARAYAGTRVFSVFGLVDGGRRLSVWLREGERTFRGELVTLRYPGSRLRMHTALHGTFSTSGVPPGRYQVGFSDDANAGIAWTAHHVEVR